MAYKWRFDQARWGTKVRVVMDALADWQAKNPGGQFLDCKGKSGEWFEVLDNGRKWKKTARLFRRPAGGGGDSK